MSANSIQPVSLTQKISSSSSFPPSSQLPWYLTQYSAAEISGWSSWLLPSEMLKDSPSRKDHMTAEEEARCRRRTVIFMEGFLEKHLLVDWQSQNAAIIFFHFFFARHSFKRHKRFEVSAACMFLAAKVEECAVKDARRLSQVRATTIYREGREGERGDENK